MANSEHSYDFLVIGGGPGGYVAAIRAAQLGMKVGCVEKGRTLGGTCLNIGCIPSKALLDSTELFHQIQARAGAHGIRVAGAEMDVPAMMERKDSVVASLTRGVEFLFRKNRVDWIRGAARLSGPDRATVTDEDGSQREIQAKRLVLATGSTPAALPDLPFDEDRVLSSTGALSLPKAPDHLVVIGGGVIGMELGSVWLRLGAKVTVLELADHILPGTDSEVAKSAEGIFRKQGFDLRTGARINRIERGKDSVRIHLASGGAVEGDRVLVAVGRRPFVGDVGAAEQGVRFNDRSAILVDAHYHTGAGAIYAIGDVIGGALLAHKAMEEGTAVAEIAAGLPGRVDYDAVANVVYTWPEIASVGMTEERARSDQREIIIGKFPFSASGRARAMNETEGLVKVIADAQSHRLLGVHVLGPRASDLISEGSLALAFQASVEDLALTVHAHPTLPEAIKEAALAALGRGIHN